MNYGDHIFCMRWVPKTLKNTGNTFNQVSSAFVHLLLADLSGSAVKVLLVLSELQSNSAPHYSKATRNRIKKLAGVSQHTLEKALEELQRVGIVEIDKKGIRLQVLKTEELGASHPRYKGCWRCGLDEPDLLEPLYFDGNARNKEKENVSFLCPTCIALVQRSKTVKGVEATWAINRHKDVEQKMLSKVAENATDVAKTAIPDSKNCYHYNKEEEPSVKEGGRERQPPGFLSGTNDYYLEPIELPPFISNPSQVEAFRVYTAARDCSRLFNEQMSVAARLGNPVPSRSFFKKADYPETYYPGWVPVEHRQLFARTFLLQATNLLCEFQRASGMDVYVVPATPTEVRQLGDLLSAFLRSPKWDIEFRRYLLWVSENKNNWSLNLLGFYIGDWQKELAK